MRLGFVKFSLFDPTYFATIEDAAYRGDHASGREAIMNNISFGSHFTDGRVALGRPWRSHHSHHSEHSRHRAGSANQADEVSPATGNVVQGSVKQALVNQVTAILKQNFNLPQASISIPGATADEQASNDLSGAVSSALHSLNGTPPADAVAAVNDAANGAIQQTAQDLQPGMGAPWELDAAVSQLRDQLQSLFSAYLANADAAQGGTNLTATGAKLVSNAKGVLEIHTQEGDTVRLSFASKSSLSVQDLKANDGTTQLSSTDIQSVGKSRVTIAVQGDLNADELQAVQDLVDQVNQLADGFFSGGNNAVMSQVGGLSFDGSQLSDFSLNLALKQTFEAYGLSLSTFPSMASNPTPAPASGNTPAIASDTPPSDQTTSAAEASTTASPAGDATAVPVVGNTISAIAA
jgi:hypothetical protein